MEPGKSGSLAACIAPELPDVDSRYEHVCTRTASEIVRDEVA